MIKRILIGLLLLASLTAYPQTNNFKWLIEQPWTTSGTDTYTTTIPGFPAAYATGMVVKIKFANAPTGTSTLNINSLGAKTLKKNGTTNIASGDLSAGQEVEVSYDGTNFQVFGIGGSGGGGGTTETASNGLTKVVNDIQLGGSFTAPIVLTGSSTNTLKGVFNSLGTTQTDGAGLWLQNSTAAAAGAQQISPMTTWEGQGWKTNATAASQSVKYAVDVLPVQSAVSPTASWRLRWSIDGSAYTDGIIYNSKDGMFLPTGSTIGLYFGTSTTVPVIKTPTSRRVTWDMQGPSSINNPSFSFSTNTAGLATSGAQSFFNFSSNGFAPTSGTGTYNFLNVLGTINQTGGANGQITGISITPTYTAAGGNVTGIDYNPTVTSVTGTHLAFRSNSGSIFFANASGDTPTTNVRTEIRGLGTTTAFGLLLESSSGTDNFGFRDDGKLFHYITPANDNALTDIIVRDGATGELKYRTVASLPGGGGISNTAANNEMMKSNGTDAVPSGLFSLASGDLRHGEASIAGSYRENTVEGSATNIDYRIVTKGNGGVHLFGNYISLVNSTNPASFTRGITFDASNPIIFSSESGTISTQFKIQGSSGNATTTAGQDLYIRGGNGRVVGNTDGGHTYIDVGAKFGSGLDGNIGFGSGSVTWQAMQRGIFISNALANPTGNPTGGGFLYADASDASKLKWRVPGGTTYDLTSGGSGLTYAQTKAIAMKIK